MAKLSDIHAFAVRWIDKFKNPEINYIELVDHYMADDCSSLGFEMDCGHAFGEKYGKAASNVEGLKRNIDSVDDIMLLGSAIYSQWRYFNHWAYSGAEILEPDNRGWFITALDRLAALTDENNKATGGIIMKYTPAAASKLLRTLQEKHDNLLSRERSLNTFGAFANEDIDKVRPDYNYSDYQKQLDELETKIRTVKHAVTVFNSTTVLPDTDGMTIDQALVYLPQLNARKRKLTTMAMRLAMERLETSRTTTAAVSEFRYANYEIADAKADYERTVAEITKIQSALDLVNNTVTLDIELESC